MRPFKGGFVIFVLVINVFKIIPSANPIFFQGLQDEDEEQGDFHEAVTTPCPPPLPPKKKHIHSYMEIFGRSNTDAEFVHRFVICLCHCVMACAQESARSKIKTITNSFILQPHPNQRFIRRRLATKLSRLFIQFYVLTMRIDLRRLYRSRRPPIWQ